MKKENVPPAAEGTKLGIICNLKHHDGSAGTPDEEAEFDEPGTVEAIRNALKCRGVETVVLEADQTLPRTLAESGITMLNPRVGRN